jgi:hypothetical protein
MIVCIKDILLLIMSMSSTSTRRKIRTLSFLYPSKPKPTKNLWSQENHACMRRFLETVKRPVEFAYMIQISLINKPSMVFP